MKYIVKNCPAFSITPNKYGNVCRVWCCSKPCQNRNDCLIKVERILRKIHELKTEIAAQDNYPHYSIVEINNMEEWIKCLKWVLEEE